LDLVNFKGIYYILQGLREVLKYTVSSPASSTWRIRNWLFYITLRFFCFNSGNILATNLAI